MALAHAECAKVQNFCYLMELRTVSKSDWQPAWQLRFNQLIIKGLYIIVVSIIQFIGTCPALMFSSRFKRREIVPHWPFSAQRI